MDGCKTRTTDMKKSTGCQRGATKKGESHLVHQALASVFEGDPGSLQVTFDLNFVLASSQLLRIINRSQYDANRE